MKDFYIGVCYSVICMILFAFAIFTPQNKSLYLYSIFPNDMTFEQLSTQFKQADARIVGEGLFKNSYILYSPKPGLLKRLDNRSFNINVQNAKLAAACVINK